MNEKNDLERIRSGEGSKFNSAIADLERQHDLLIECNRASRVLDYPRWCTSLNALYRELIIWADEKEKTAIDKKRVKNVPTNVKASNYFYSRLDDFETELRVFRAKKKLGIIAEEDASTAALR